MKTGKYSKNVRKRRLRWSKQFVLLASIAAMLVGVIGGTLAYLTTETSEVVNTFTPASGGVDIHEDFDQESKTNVYFTNTGDYPVYMRATYVAYLKDADGNISPIAPPLKVKDINTTDWEERDDGYYYYKESVAAGDPTSNFINEITVEYNDEVPEGHYLVVDVIVETVQAEPKQAALELWGYYPGYTG